MGASEARAQAIGFLTAAYGDLREMEETLEPGPRDAYHAALQAIDDVPGVLTQLGILFTEFGRMVEQRYGADYLVWLQERARETEVWEPPDDTPL
jgi:hypothetical protein